MALLLLLLRSTLMRDAGFVFLSMIVSQIAICDTGDNSTEQACELHPQHRLGCGAYGVAMDSCQEAGCCFDSVLSQCYFPTDCRLVLSTAGGYSAFFLLPGRERPGDGTMAMLEGGKWCARNVDPVQEHLHIELELLEQQTVYVLISQAPADVGLQPFNISYTQPRSDWLYLEITNDEPENTLSRYGSKTMTIFQADKIRIHPEMTSRNPCVKIEFVACQAQPLSPKNMSSPAPPRLEPVILHEMISPDAEPVSIFIGVVSMTSMLCILGCIVLLDIPTLKTHFCYMRRNIRDFKDTCKRKSDVNGYVTHDLAEVERLQSLMYPYRPGPPDSDEDANSLMEHESSI